MGAALTATANSHPANIAIPVFVLIPLAISIRVAVAIVDCSDVVVAIVDRTPKP